MAGTEWLSIGQFARATGLTAKALRHYDGLGLLAPAAIDPVNGYRRYVADQVPVGRLVRRLRDLELRSTRSSDCSATAKDRPWTPPCASTAGGWRHAPRVCAGSCTTSITSSPMEGTR